MTVRAAFGAAGLALWLAAAGCRDAPPERGHTPPPPSAADTGAVRVGLTLPTAPAWNQDDSLRITLRNGLRTPLANATLVLLVPAGMSLATDSGAAGRPRADSSATQRMLSFALPLVPPGGVLELWQRLRTPAAPVVVPPAPPAPGTPAPPAPRTRAAKPDTSTRLPIFVQLRVGADTVALAQDTLRVRPGSEVAVGGCGNATGTVVSRYGIGPVRVGMPLSALRMACPEARDSSWAGSEGTRESGVLVLPGGAPALAVVAGGTVTRILVDRPGPRTAAGAGIGASVGELRDLYGRLCAGRGEGGVAVWFPNAPGISFGLDTASTRGWSARHAASDSIPDDLKITSLWVRQGSDDCPARPGESGR